MCCGYLGETKRQDLKSNKANKKKSKPEILRRTQASGQASNQASNQSTQVDQSIGRRAKTIQPGKIPGTARTHPQRLTHLPPPPNERANERTHRLGRDSPVSQPTPHSPRRTLSSTHPLSTPNHIQPNSIQQAFSSTVHSVPTQFSATEDTLPGRTEHRPLATTPSASTALLPLRRLRYGKTKSLPLTTTRASLRSTPDQV